jgi:uncharacterized protein YdhG (YjbR/CyaY superfamily)
MSRRDKIVRALEAELEKPEVVANLRMLTPEVYAQLRALLENLADESSYMQEMMYKNQMRAVEIEIAKKHYEEQMFQKVQSLGTYAADNTRF